MKRRKGRVHPFGSVAGVGRPPSVARCGRCSGSTPVHPPPTFLFSIAHSAFCDCRSVRKCYVSMLSSQSGRAARIGRGLQPSDNGALAVLKEIPRDLACLVSAFVEVS